MAIETYFSLLINIIMKLKSVVIPIPRVEKFKLHPLIRLSLRLPHGNNHVELAFIKSEVYPFVSIIIFLIKMAVIS